MRTVDGKSYVAFTGTGQGQPFPLYGGKYQFAAHVNAGSALGFGLSQLSADGTNYIPLFAVIAHVNNIQTVDLPPGTYEFTCTGTPGTGESVDIGIWRVPTD